ncbi:hypothetical protein BU24DRAFT_418378 [Aaosphaeria arxii CBS 175.79]|uniref:Uncharacterized protein n=1 Tax=Aaosphaeria arxii CBS 175.79 TaxID=1450172 RepID=A0A6A5Y0V3_9PLEO|nr:uncharacterized protein BU24DRAFT_418378 [Aaosphaeria arxii CBS 175.79]KAF2018823.1 hypothetical protein BU24DRAFT_418378 [Aaosphaeria arxii CBS 175.79]
MDGSTGDVTAWRRWEGEDISARYWVMFGDGVYYVWMLCGLRMLLCGLDTSSYLERVPRLFVVLAQFSSAQVTMVRC